MKSTRETIIHCIHLMGSEYVGSRTLLAFPDTPLGRGKARTGVCHRDSRFPGPTTGAVKAQRDDPSASLDLGVFEPLVKGGRDRDEMQGAHATAANVTRDSRRAWECSDWSWRTDGLGSSGNILRWLVRVKRHGPFATDL